MKKITEPDFIRTCPCCKGVFQFEKKDLEWQHGGRHTFGYNFVACPYCDRKVRVWSEGKVKYD